MRRCTHRAGGHGLPGAPQAWAVFREGLVVHAQGRPVRCLPDGDIEDIGVITGGEHRTAHLEQQKIVGGLEVPGQVGLDQSGADGPEIVGKPDADARLPARRGQRGREKLLPCRILINAVRYKSGV